MTNLFDFGTRDPEEIVRIAAGNLIHTKVYMQDVERVFPHLKGSYDLRKMRDPEEIYKDVQEGRVFVVNANDDSVAYERPNRFVDPSTLQTNQRFPHECMGIQE